MLRFVFMGFVVGGPRNRKRRYVGPSFFTAQVFNILIFNMYWKDG